MVTKNDQQIAGEQIAEEIKKAALQGDVESMRKKTEDGVFVATHCHNEEDRTSAFCEALDYLPSLGTIIKTVGVGALLYGASRVLNESANALSKPIDLTSENGPSNLAVDMEIFQASEPMKNQEVFQDITRHLRTDDLDTSKSWTDQAGEDLSVSRPEDFLEGFDEKNIVQDIAIQSDSEYPTAMPSSAPTRTPPRYTRAPTQSPTNSAPTSVPSYPDNHPDFRAPTPAPTPPGPEELSDGAIVGITIASIVAAATAAYCTVRQCAKGSPSPDSHVPVAQPDRQMTQL